MAHSGNTNAVRYRKPSHGMCRPKNANAVFIVKLLCGLPQHVLPGVGLHRVNPPPRPCHHANEGVTGQGRDTLTICLRRGLLSISNGVLNRQEDMKSDSIRIGKRYRRHRQGARRTITLPMLTSAGRKPCLRTV